MTSSYGQIKVKIRSKTTQLSKNNFKDAQIGRATYLKLCFILKKILGSATHKKVNSSIHQFFNLQ
jgi:hypothetical protein